MVNTPSTKEKLEKQLHLLKESFNSGIIDKEEYESSKSIVEKKIEELPKLPEQPAQPPSQMGSENESSKKYHWDQKDNFKEYFGENSHSQELGEEPQKNEVVEKTEGEKEEPLEKQTEPKEEIQEEKTKNIEQKSEKVEKEHSQKDEGLLTPKPSTLQKPEEKEKIDGGEESKPKVEVVKEDLPLPESAEKKSRIWTWILGAIIVVVILYLSSMGLMKDDPEPAPIQPPVELAPTYACMMDSDCAEKSKEYKCLNPGTEQAECVVQDAIPLTLTILNKGDCAQCDPKRILTILKKWFPGIQERVVEISSVEGKQLKEEHSITMLPAYILNGNLPATMRFEEVGRAFSQSGDDYIMKNNAAGARLYLEREETPNHLTVLLADDATSFRAAKNMKEFTDLFGSQITVQFFFTKDTEVAKQHACVAEEGVDAYLRYASCYQEQESLADCAQAAEIFAEDITTCVEGEEVNILIENGVFMKDVFNLLSVPAFIINDNLRMMGVQSANDLKHEYCLRNPDEKCAVELTAKLV